MVKLYLQGYFLRFSFIWLLVAGMFSAAHAVVIRPDSTRTATYTKITDTRKDKPAFLKTNLKVAVVPFKPSPIRTNATPAANGKTNAANDKVLSNVKVYPNPVSDQLNVSYNVSKDVLMTIKIMDFLGNELGTLATQRVAEGDQTASFNISSRFNSGLYFIRFIAGNETVIKRISIL